MVVKATPGRRGPQGPRLSWGSEKLLIRCGRESSAEGAPDELELETRCGRESHSRPKGPSGPPVVSETRL